MGGRNPEDEWDFPASISPKTRAKIEKKPREPVIRFGQTIYVGDIKLVETHRRVDSGTADMVKRNLIALFGPGPWSDKPTATEPNSAEPITDAEERDPDES